MFEVITFESYYPLLRLTVNVNNNRLHLVLLEFLFFAVISFSTCILQSILPLGNHTTSAYDAAVPLFTIVGHLSNRKIGHLHVGDA